MKHLKTEEEVNEYIAKYDDQKWAKNTEGRSFEERQEAARKHFRYVRKQQRIQNSVRALTTAAKKANKKTEAREETRKFNEWKKAKQARDAEKVKSSSTVDRSSDSVVNTDQ